MGSSFQGYFNTRLEELSSLLKAPMKNKNEVDKFLEDVRRTWNGIPNYGHFFPLNDWCEIMNNLDLYESFRFYLTKKLRSFLWELINNRRPIFETETRLGRKRTEEVKVSMEVTEEMERKREEREEYLIWLYQNQTFLNDMVLKEVESMEEREWKKEEIDEYLIWLYQNPNIVIDMGLEEVESMEKMNDRRTSMESGAANQVNNSGKNSMMGMGGNGTTYITNRDSTIINHYHSITIK